MTPEQAIQAMHLAPDYEQIEIRDEEPVVYPEGSGFTPLHRVIRITRASESLNMRLVTDVHYTNNVLGVPTIISGVTHGEVTSY